MNNFKKVIASSTREYTVLDMTFSPLEARRNLNYTDENVQGFIGQCKEAISCFKELVNDAIREHPTCTGYTMLFMKTFVIVAALGLGMAGLYALGRLNWGLENKVTDTTNGDKGISTQYLPTHFLTEASHMLFKSVIYGQTVRLLTRDYVNELFRSDAKNSTVTNLKHYKKVLKEKIELELVSDTQKSTRYLELVETYLKEMDTIIAPDSTPTTNAFYRSSWGVWVVGIVALGLSSADPESKYTYIASSLLATAVQTLLDMSYDSKMSHETKIQIKTLRNIQEELKALKEEGITPIVPTLLSTHQELLDNKQVKKRLKQH